MHLKIGSRISLLIVFGYLIFIFSCEPKSKARNRFNAEQPKKIALPYVFKTDTAEKLSIRAFNLRAGKRFDMAIDLYRQAIEIEPDNPRLYFDLSECYTSTDKLEQGILLLDTAIILDKSFPAFYNNRGLIYWKLGKIQIAINDYKSAIALDSTNHIYYANLSLVYYSNNKMTDACETFKKAKHLGLNLTDGIDHGDLQILEVLCK